MRTTWNDDGVDKSVTAPMSLIVSAFAPVTDARLTATPQLRPQAEASLLLIDLGRGANRLGGSALAQSCGQTGDTVPDVDSTDLKRFFTLIQAYLRDGKLLAYHDRSDGGLLATLAEMAFAGHCGLAVDLAAVPGDDMGRMFNEEAGAVVQLADADVAGFRERAAALGLDDCVHTIGRATPDEALEIKHGDRSILSGQRGVVQSLWARTSYQMQALRDNPACAAEEFARIEMPDPGLSASLELCSG